MQTLYVPGQYVGGECNIQLYDYVARAVRHCRDISYHSAIIALS